MSSTQVIVSGGADDGFDAEIGRRVHQLMWDRQITQTAFARLIDMDEGFAEVSKHTLTGGEIV